MNKICRHEGFLLTRQWQDRNGALELVFWLKGAEQALKLVFTGQQSVFFVSANQLEACRAVLDRLSLRWEEKAVQLCDFEHQPVRAFYFNQQKQLYYARDQLKQKGVILLEADIQPSDRFLMERFITAGACVNGEARQRDGYLEYYNPQIKAVDFRPGLRVLSLDIETSMRGDKLYSIACTCYTYHIKGSYEQPEADRIFMVGQADEINNDISHDNNNNNNEDDGILKAALELYTDEKMLLNAFLAWYQHYDADVIIGWNVINFDFRFLQKKSDEHRISLKLGRGGTLPDWRQSRRDEHHFTLLLPGRSVLDGIDTLKSATYMFESFALDSVAKSLLNRGKLLDNKETRGNDITDLFLSDKLSLAAYNLRDCQLVWDIFEHTKLMDFALERAHLTGLSMDRFGGSVAAFDHRYLPRLHREGYVAPCLQDEPEGVGSPGGYVMDSTPGLYRYVLVLDFKSLYPSIIRTFKIDPMALIKGRKLAQDALGALDEGNKATNEEAFIRDRLETKNLNTESLVAGFNGAVFDKQSALLPDIITELWQARDHAKRDKNASMSQAIKIIMNSFYGVLGTPGCRFFDYRLPSSITLRGHQILTQTKTLIEQQGHKVIYGDTDSVFVYLDMQGETKPAAQINQVGKQLANDLNQWWTDYIQERYQLESYLELEFETAFERFVMPTIRGSEKGSKKRYAGRLLDGGADDSLIFKGLEAVRTDWTMLARRFQRELYRRIFFDEPYEQYIRDLVADVLAGRCDDELVYRKRLRRQLDEYVRNIPPHVQAARIAEANRAELDLPVQYRRGSWVSYVLTASGPQPLEYCIAKLDYEEYIERQVIPVADGVLHFLGQSFEEIAGPQFSLF
ncbi:MAG: DNA polymerase II [Alteromonadaceae bacterium]|nr:MAG: DNA polymerase II [Alteromonadaceae bacterium]